MDLERSELWTKFFSPVWMDDGRRRRVNASYVYYADKKRGVLLNKYNSSKNTSPSYKNTI